MFLLRVACAGLLALAACASPGSVSPRAETSASATRRPDPLTYGVRPENPVRVGWGDRGVMTYFDALRGPQGQRVAWRRVGTCCEFKLADERATGQGQLEMFEVTYDGLEEPVVMYVDPYTWGDIYAPRGFMLDVSSPGTEPVPDSRPDVIEL